MHGPDPAELIASQMRPGRVLLLGEIHGTEEFPAIVARAVRQRVKRGAVLVGVELKIEQVTDVGGVSWRVAPHCQDGRTSAAMAGLLGALKDLVGVAAFSALPEANARQTDAGMASVISAQTARSADAAALVLLGNAHASTLPSDRFPSSPTGQYLRSAGVDVVSILGVPSGGTYWAITEFHGRGGVVRLGTVPSGHLTGCYDMTVEIGAVSASPPVSMSGFPGCWTT